MNLLIATWVFLPALGTILSGSPSLHGLRLSADAPLPVWAQWLIILLLFDLWQYTWHRINHRVRFLWRFHSVHHVDADMDASTAVRFHPVEIMLSFLARTVVMSLLGMSVGQMLLYESILLPVILFHHSNIKIPERSDRALRWLIVTPYMHWVHHSERQPETDSNYSSLLSVWDRIFRSFRLRPDPERIVLGLDSYPEVNWRSIRGSLMMPFMTLPTHRESDADQQSQV